MSERYNLRFLDELAAMRVLVKAMLVRQRWLKYSPDQPRAPAGQPDGGQWINWNRTREAMGLYDEANRAKCELQYDSDMFQCSFAASARSRQACREQAQSRFTLCMKNLPIPDLIYYLG